MEVTIHCWRAVTTLSEGDTSVSINLVCFYFRQASMFLLSLQFIAPSNWGNAKTGHVGVSKWQNENVMAIRGRTWGDSKLDLLVRAGSFHWKHPRVHIEAASLMWTFHIIQVFHHLRLFPVKVYCLQISIAYTEMIDALLWFAVALAVPNDNVTELVLHFLQSVSQCRLKTGRKNTNFVRVYKDTPKALGR